jgi:hypothetical protein
VVSDRTSFRTVDGTIKHSRLVDAFVDDTAVGITDDGSLSMQELVSSLESIAQKWEKLLHFSGGALNLNKCSWYVMYWDWQQGRPILRKATEQDQTVSLTQGSHKTKVPISRQDPTIASKLLGVYQTPVGDFSEHIQVLKTKADTYAGYLRSPRLTTNDIRVFQRVIYSPAMRYSLPALAVNEEEIATIQSRIIPTIVNRLGLSSKLPTAIRFGPVSLGGLGLLDLRTENGIEMIKYFRHEIFGRTQVGQLLLLQVRASQLEAGIKNQILEEPSIKISYLTPTWVLSMRQFMSNHNISITLTDRWERKLEGKHDRYIMSLVFLQRYSIRQQTDINLVRIYLQVHTLNDMIDTAEPDKIASWAMAGVRDIGFENNAGWPRQQEPSLAQKRIWRRYISSNYLRYQRFWKYSPGMRKQDRHSVAGEDEAHVFDGGIPALIYNLPRTQKRMLMHVHQVASDDQVRNACRCKRPITIASDGGLKGTRGTFGWSIRTSHHTVLLEGAGPVDGPSDVVNSTRCELAGYAASLLILSLIQQLWGTRHRCKFRWVTDSKAAISNVNRALDGERLIRRQPNNPDLMAIIKKETQGFRRRVKPIWVKGHQTADDPSISASTYNDVQGNNRADELATWYREDSGTRQSSNQTDHVPESLISISLNGKRRVSQVEACIRYHIYGYHLRSYLQLTNKWSDNTWDSIDIEALGVFIKRMDYKSQIARTKFVFDQWHTGYRRHQIAKRKDPILLKCPC